MSDQLDRIEMYVLGQLSAQEKQRFEQEMKTNPALTDEVSRMRTIHDALEISVEDDLRQKLQRMRESEKHYSSSKPDVIIHPLYSRLAIAAGILIILFAGIWLFMNRESDSLIAFRDQQYLDYDYSRMRGDQNPAYSLPFEIGQDKAGKQKAIQWFSSWLDTHPDDDEAHFIVADLLYKTGHTDQAKAHLLMIIRHPSIRWREKAEWNYVLMSLPLPWDETAKRLFDDIRHNPDHSYYTQAKALEDKLAK
jgi:hypothetical protein